MSCPSCQNYFDQFEKIPCKFNCGHDICRLCAINSSFQGQPFCQKCNQSQQFGVNQTMLDRIIQVNEKKKASKNQNELQCEFHQATNNNICIDCHEVLCNLCQKQHNEHKIQPKEQALHFYQTEFFKQPQNIINEQKVQVAQKLSSDYQQIINKLQQQHEQLQQQLNNIQKQILQQAEQQFQNNLQPLNKQIEDSQNNLQVKMQNAQKTIELAKEVQSSLNAVPQNNTDLLLKFAQAYDACQNIQGSQDQGFKITEITIDEQMLQQIQQTLENCVELQVKDLIVEDLKARVAQVQEVKQINQEVQQINQAVQKININVDMLLQNEIKEQEIDLFKEA